MDDSRSASLRRLTPYARRLLRYKRRVAGGFLSIPLSQGADVAITLVVGDALNRLEAGDDGAFLPRAFALVLAWAALHALLRFGTRWWVTSASRLFERDLKRELFAKLTSLPFSFHDRSRSGDVVSRLTSDVENLRMFLGPGLMYSSSALVTLPVSLVVLGRIDPTLTAVMAVPLFGIGLSMRLLGPRLARHSKAVQESLADIGSRAQDGFAGIRVVKGFGREDEEARRFGESSRVNMSNQIALLRARGLTHALAEVSYQLTLVAILALGGLALMRGGMRAGDLFKFIDLSMKMFWPVLALGWLAGMWPRAATSAERLDELLGLEPEIADPAAPVDAPANGGALRFDDVSFTYPGAARPALQGVSAAVPAGGTLGVVGPTGSGKTTLLSLLGRLQDAGGGVLVDGVPVGRLRLDDLRARFGYVPQDGFLFSDTWRENVAFGAEGPLDDARAAELAETACMTDELARFPDGLDQRIGERGVTLSGGQRQRTCIARALAREPRVLVLDDCLSAVDTSTERRLLANLRAAGAGRTVVVAAHRLSAVADADEIVVLSARGRVADRGTHAELLARPGWYRDTWRRQETREELEEL